MDEDSFQFMFNCSSDIDYGEDNADGTETESDAAQQSSSAKKPSPIIFAKDNPTKFLSRQNNPDGTSTSAQQDIDSRTPAQINPLTSCSLVEVQPSTSSQNVVSPNPAPDFSSTLTPPVIEDQNMEVQQPGAHRSSSPVQENTQFPSREILLVNSLTPSAPMIEGQNLEAQPSTSSAPQHVVPNPVISLTSSPPAIEGNLGDEELIPIDPVEDSHQFELAGRDTCEPFQNPGTEQSLPNQMEKETTAEEIKQEIEVLSEIPKKIKTTNADEFLKRKAEQHEQHEQMRRMSQQSVSSASHQQLHNPEWSDDRDGYLCCVRGNCIEGKYEVVKQLGIGVFAKVVQVRDLADGKDKALKIVRNTPAYREAAKQEIRTLKALQQADPKGQNRFVVRLLDHFEFNGHYCLLFNNYGENVFEFMKKNKYHPYPMDQVRFIAYQLIHAVKFIHDQSLTHTDLKPENILFVDTSKANTTMVQRWYIPDELWALPAKQRPKKNAKFKVLKDASIRLIDLGSAVFEGQRKDEIVSTRHYRAPEIILKLGWDQSCDVWSLGCIFFELYTGHPLFPRMDDHRHLAVIERSVGSIPNAMKRQSRIKSNDLFYDAHGQLNCDEGIQAFAERRGKPFEEYMQSQGIGHQHLFRLIADMLSIDPTERLTLAEAKQHVFFNENFDEEAENNANGLEQQKNTAMCSQNNNSKKENEIDIITLEKNPMDEKQIYAKQMRKLIVDEPIKLTNDQMEANMKDYSDTLAKPDLAPTTKEHMQFIKNNQFERILTTPACFEWLMDPFIIDLYKSHLVPKALQMDEIDKQNMDLVVLEEDEDDQYSQCVVESNEENEKLNSDWMLVSKTPGSPNSLVEIQETEEEEISLQQKTTQNVRQVDDIHAAISQPNYVFGIPIRRIQREAKRIRKRNY